MSFDWLRGGLLYLQVLVRKHEAHLLSTYLCIQRVQIQTEVAHILWNIIYLFLTLYNKNIAS